MTTNADFLAEAGPLEPGFNHEKKEKSVKMEVKQCERLFKCVDCVKAFKTGQHLNCHKTVHTGEKLQSHNKKFIIPDKRMSKIFGKEDI